MEKLPIGRKDRIDIPAFEMKDIPVKIDSWAYSSSIHCKLVKEITQDNKKQLEVIFLDESNKSFTGKPFYFDEYKTKKVKSSTGHEQERFFIQLKIILFDREFITDFSLTQRNGLRHPILLGRKLTSKNFIIDTALTNLSYKNKLKTKLNT